MYDGLTSPVRRALLDALVERDGRTPYELTARLLADDVTTGCRQAITRHLDVLERSGSPTVERRGRCRLHHLDVPGPREIRSRWRLHDTPDADG